MAKKQKTEAKKANAAFLKPVQPDDSLAAIVGSTPLPRTELTKKLWEYIRKHKLQDPKEKRNINADDKRQAEGFNVRNDQACERTPPLRAFLDTLRWFGRALHDELIQELPGTDLVII
jgi:hypothetical protein